MKKKLLILVLFLCGILSVFAGCRKQEKDPNAITSYLKDLDSYSTDFTMEVKNDRQTITYKGVQYFKKKQGYRIELDNNRVFIYKGDNIFVNDLINGFKYTLNKEFDNLYRISLIGEYIGLLYTNEDIKNSFKKIDSTEYQLVELIIPGGSRDVNKAVMYLNTKESLPERIIIYDISGKETVKITYGDFQPQADIQDDLFKTN